MERNYITTHYFYTLSCGCVKKSKTRLFKENTVYCSKHHYFVEVVDACMHEEKVYAENTIE